MLLVCHCWEWERKSTWDWAPGQVAVLQHCTATPCSNSSHIRHARVMDHGEHCGHCQEVQGPIRSFWDSARTPRHVGFSGSAAIRPLLNYKGQCYMSIPEVPEALLERCYVLKRTETNQVSAGFLLALQVRDPGTAEDLFRQHNLGAL